MSVWGAAFLIENVQQIVELKINEIHYKMRNYKWETRSYRFDSIEMVQSNLFNLICAHLSIELIIDLSIDWTAEKYG